MTALDTHNAHGLPDVLRGANVNFERPAGGLGTGLLVVGVLMALAGWGLGVSGAMGFTLAHALASYMVGVMAVLAVCLGATFFLMVFYLLNAGWSAGIKRQLENIASFLPWAWAMLLPILGVEIAKDGLLFQWLSDANSADYLLNKKGVYFFFPLGSTPEVFPAFFVLRTLFYGVFWWFLTSRLISLSKEQDRTGSPELSAKLRFMSAWGMPIFALSMAFVAFDYLMALDFRFFSTMWGVYYFAGAAFASIACVSLVLNFLLRKGKLRGVVSTEHFHDLGKLQFSFTVFWAYISFSQYFLIYYANIPEETAFFLHRKEHGWMGLGIFLMIGHFVAPFLIILSRHVKKNLNLMLIMSTWCLVVHVADMYWIVRPMAYPVTPTPDGPVQTGPGMSALVLDVVAILGICLVFAGYLVKRVSSNQLAAVRDPYMHESLEHKNYV